MKRSNDNNEIVIYGLLNASVSLQIFLTLTHASGIITVDRLIITNAIEQTRNFY